MEQLEPADAVVLARESNDFLAEAIAKNPTRFGAFAALPTSSPDRAAEELQRRATNHAFQGAVVNGHTRGRYLDDPFFSPILECANSLSVPIYLHPTPPPEPVCQAWFSGFAPFVSEMLAGAGWGWHIETALHVIRMILGGVFDRFPNLQIIVGHMGETLPFMLQRLDVMPTAMTKLQRPMSCTCGGTSTTPLADSTSLPLFSTYFCKWASNALCSPPIIRTPRWHRRVLSWTSCR